MGQIGKGTFKKEWLESLKVRMGKLEAIEDVRKELYFS